MSKPGPTLSLKTVFMALIFCASAFLFVRETLARQPASSPVGSPQSAAPSQTIPQMLQSIIANLDPPSLTVNNAARAAQLRAKLDDKTNPMEPRERIKTEINYGYELLNAGKTEEALRVYTTAEQDMRKTLPDEWRKVASDFMTREAICYLRMGEQQNCCANNNARSCIAPISGSGIHTKQYGSRHAIARLTEALHENPDNMAARWLLNIACMTVGEYPQNVPARWLISAKRLGGDYPMKPFYNAAPELGLDVLGWSGSVIMEDFEGNGLLDLLLCSGRIEGQLRYFRNNGDGTFTERTNEAGLIGEVGGLNMITTDYNNDGRPDVVILRGGNYAKNGHFPLSLLRNDGKGHFTDVTIQAGLLHCGPTSWAVAFDYNSDGRLDLFVGYESNPRDPVSCKLFRNNGNGTFTDVTDVCGLDLYYPIKGVITADFLHTGRPGLYISCFHHSNILLRNDGPTGPDKSPMAPWKFTDISHQAGVDKQRSSFPCLFFDYDNDGWPDLFVVGFGRADAEAVSNNEAFGIEDDASLSDSVNLGSAPKPVAGPRDEFGLMHNGADGINVGDLANDYLGLPTVAQKAKLYRNNHNGTFTDITKQAHLDKAIYGMAANFGDFDNDGWLDIYVGTGDPDMGTLIPKRMFRNHDGKYFDEVTMTGGFGHLQKGHGCAFGDLNNNGQPDIYMALGGAWEGDTAHSCLFINPGNKNHWVTLKLEGVKSNRIALGAEICVTVATPQGERKIYRTVSTGGSFGCSPLRQEIGLGDATAIRQVEVRWPATGITQTVRNVGMDGFYRLREGDATAQPWKVPTFKLPHQSVVFPSVSVTTRSAATLR